MRDLSEGHCLYRVPAHIVMVDDHPIVRKGVRLLLETHPQFKIIGEASNRLEALTLTTQLQPDVILLDLHLHGEDGLELLPELLIAGQSARILVLTGVTDAEVHYRAVRLGALGVVLKGHEPETLIRAIESVLSGEVWLDHHLTVRLLSEMLGNGESEKLDPEAAKIVRLTAREREVVSLIGEGLRNKQVAERLFISEVTVRHHLTSIFNKLEVQDRFELAIYAYRHGLAKPPFSRAEVINECAAD